MKVRDFERLFSSSRDRLYGYALYYLGDREDAEDVVQEVFLRLWQRRGSVRRSGAYGWTVSVTRNLCRDRLRRRKVRSVVNVDSDAVDDFAAAEASPEELAAAADFDALLREAIVELPEPQKSIVILREIQRMSYNEICAALDLPMSRVKVYLHRGRRTLRNKLMRVTNREVA